MEKYGNIQIFECSYCHEIQKKGSHQTLLICCETQLEKQSEADSGISYIDNRWIRREDLEHEEI